MNPGTGVKLFGVSVMGVIAFLIFINGFDYVERSNNVTYYSNSQQAQQVYQAALANSSNTIPLVIVPESNGNGAFIIKGNITTPLTTNSTLTQNIVNVIQKQQVQLITTLGKTTSDGQTTYVNGTSNLNFIPENILVEKGQFVNYLNGKMSLGFVVKTEKPNQSVLATGKLFANVNGVSLNPNGVDFGIKGNSSNNGIISLKFDTPLGFLDTYDVLLSNVNIVPGLNNISFNVDTFATVVNGHKYGFTNTTKVFDLTLDYEPNYVIIKNADGSNALVYPTDDRFTLSSGSVTTYPEYCVSAGKGSISYCAKAYSYGTPLPGSTIYAHAGTISVYQGTKQIATATDSIALFLQRSTTYEVKVPTMGVDYIFTTPVSQQNYDYSCSAWTLIHNIRVIDEVPQYVVAPTTCNIPTK